jgi:mRNA interferase HigB
MHVISIKKLREFWGQYEDAEDPLRTWYKVVEKARWTSLVDVRRTYSHADFVDPHHTVFNIGGNKYRLIVKIEYAYELIFIEHVLTHKEYDEGKWK